MIIQSCYSKFLTIPIFKWLCHLCHLCNGVPILLARQCMFIFNSEHLLINRIITRVSRKQKKYKITTCASVNAIGVTISEVNWDQ